MNTYEIIDYELLHNEVNNAYKIGVLDLPEEWEFNDIVSAFIELGFKDISKRAELDNNTDLSWNIYLIDKKGRPFCELRRLENDSN